MVCDFHDTGAGSGLCTNRKARCSQRRLHSARDCRYSASIQVLCDACSNARRVTGLHSSKGAAQITALPDHSMDCSLYGASVDCLRTVCYVNLHSTKTQSQNRVRPSVVANTNVQAMCITRHHKDIPPEQLCTIANNGRGRHINAAIAVIMLKCTNFL
jgi:hypothetical protein